MKTTNLQLKTLPAALLAVLCSVPLLAQSETPDTAAAAAAAADADKGAPEKVLVTGSRIPRATLEGPSAVTVITNADLTKQGYKNVFDALTNLNQNSGFVQGEDFGNTFTPSATTISLRGMGPNHTLVLLNGRRLADFPIAYGGTVNFTNLANIPSAIVDRIEILTGGASAIYGSDAIAGVVNVILKRQAEGFDVNLKLGGLSRGGGANRRLQFTGGHSEGALNTLFAIELSDRDPLWSRDRDFMATRPSATPTVILGRRDVKTKNYLDLGDACSQLGDLYYGSVVKTPAKGGSNCTSQNVGPTWWTTQTGNRSKNAFGSATYALNDNHTLFADVLLGGNDTYNNTRGPSWTSASTNGSYFLNQNTGAYEAWNKYIAPEEIGGANRYNRNWTDKAFSVSLGSRGHITGTSWDYEASYSGSLYRSRSQTPRALANIDSFFLGPKLGVDKSGVSIYAPDQARLTKRLTPAEFDTITGLSIAKDESWTNTLSVTANGEVWQLPAGPLRVATVAEVGRQGFSNTPDLAGNDGIYNSTSKVDITAGTRNRYALGAEVSVPLLKQLTATLAGRYDRYSFAGRNDGKFTYNTGLEFRPAEQLLLRGNYATSFRAPDMNYIYKARGTGYYSSSTDYLRCAQAGQELDKCEYANRSPGFDYVQIGSKELKSERGTSYGAGVVWSPSTSFDVSLDYYNIKIDDQVTNLSSDALLRDEARCGTGKLDPKSPTCLDVYSRITRNPATALNKPNEVNSIRVNPINAAHESTSGIDLAAKYALRTASLGNFLWNASYSKVLTKRSRQFAGDELEDELNSMDSTDWRDKGKLSVSWNIGDWSSTLAASYYGKIPQSNGKGYLTPTTLLNGSVVYQLNKRTTLSLVVNNLLNRVKHDTTGGWPYYPIGSYSPAGRAGWVELNYHFGS
ncbi:TonB-dependent siderophore receptor [Massilia sp. NR 4-1]|uniref:TonB-dependent receptor plug domain-containing protein n=1 Tax=Massilia sp. NR 4-1 TaxID=1678028 RepID=UPI00067AE72B|nr:TonB-dependent receptor [Massilia sp. NR 4-1]AKU22955.1 TonB-dependent receptor [Massilia sp. NR 4-1]